MTTRTRSWRLSALLLALLMAVAACAGGDDGAADDDAAAADDDAATADAGADATEGEDAADAAPAEDLGSLSVGLICGGLTPMTAMMAINAETFPEGLEIEKICFDGGSEAVQALIGGSLDVFMGSLEHVISTQTQGLPTRAYGVINNRVPYALVSPPDGVTSVPELVGTQVGITSPGSLSDTELKIAADQEGIAYEDMTVVGAGAGATMTAALTSGSISAGMVSDPQLSELVSEGYNVVWEPDFDFVAIAVVANSETVEERRPSFEAFMQGLLTAAEEAEADLDWAVEAMLEEGFEVEEDVLAASVEAGVAAIPPGLTVDESVYDETIELLISVDRADEAEAPPFDEAIDLSLLPSS